MCSTAYSSRVLRLAFPPRHRPCTGDGGAVDAAADAPLHRPSDTRRTPVVPVTRIDWDGLRDRATTLPLGLNARSSLITPDGKTLVFRAAERGQENFYSYDLDELPPSRPLRAS
jgi:Tol biopolymer transport system component